MKCINCGGNVLWDWPVRWDGINRTTCQKCGAKDSQVIEGKINEDE